ncbi:MAG: two-component system, OmpR family, phosphate regulon sensor histidine kinase PhoR, partial [Parcubacteria group bacterium Greene0714_4]
RTPLTALEWSLNELLEGDFGELKKNQKKLVEDIVIANKRLIRLVNSLLDVARLEEGKRGMSMQKQDIVSVVQGVGDQFKKIAKEKRIGFSFESSAKSLLVDFDKEKLNIALTNLVDNAVKYTPAGGAINLSVAGMEKEVCIAVTDTGIGIPEEQANKIFSKFFRARNAMLLETYGSGLGLSVAKDIVERHQGTIAFTSNVGGGSIFTITLPRA